MNAMPPLDDRGQDALRDTVIDWFIRRGRDNWGPADEQAFERWMDEDPRHRAACAEWLMHWERLGELSADAFTPSVTAPAGRGATPAAAAPAPVPGASRARRRLVWGLGGAMAALGSGAIGLRLFQDWQRARALPLFVEQIETGRGESREWRLPDGSRVQLDTLTRIEARYFRDRRELRLSEGQALFAVQPDPTRPFEVHAAGVVATALGTRYTVRHTPGISAPGVVDVAVVSGVVRVGHLGHLGHLGQERPAPSGAGATTRSLGTPSKTVMDAGGGGAGAEPFVLLAAGQRLIVDAQGGRTLTELPVTEIGAWRRHRVSFVNAPLAQALAEFERYGPTGLAFDDPRVGALRLSGTFDPRDVVTLRRVLPAALPLRLVPREGTWTLVLAR